MADTNTLGQVPESNNIDSLYTEVDNTLSLVHEVPSTITETSIHNTTSVNLGTDRENDDSLKINKEEKVSLRGLEDKKNTYAPTANLDVAHFADKRFISKQLSDKNDTVIMADLDKEIIRSYETDVVLANALNLEDEEREIADAQLRADIAKEALERANADSNLAEIIEKYKYAMSQHITTRELDVNGDTRLNIEVVDGDNHGGNLDVETSLVVGSENAENGTTTSEGKVIGDAHIKHDLFVDNDTTIGNDLLVENDSHIMNDLLVDQNATIEGNLDVNGTTTLNELEIENNLSVGGNLKVEGDTDLDKTLNVDGAVTLNDTLTVEKDTTLKDDLVVNKTATIDGATQLNNTLTVEKATQLNDTLGVKKATTLEDTLNVKKGTLLEDTLQVNKRTDIGTNQTNADLYVHGSEYISNNLNVTETSNLGTTNIGTAEANKNLTVNGNETITGNLNVNTNTDLDGTLNVDGETTLNANVKIKDDSNTQKSFSDIIGTIKNALIKDFTQSYNSTTGQLTSTLTFNNLYSGNTNRPTVSTITKTINLDLEKYILDINDVYATKTISNGKTTYTDFDISTLTDEEIRDLDSPDYTGNIVRCLKVKYNTYNNTNAGTEKSYVYFEINDIFKSIISKLELEINNEITARNNAITNAINNLDVASVGSNGGYIKTISETNGKISAARQPFDTSISSSSTANNAPTSKAVYDFIGTLDVAAVGQDGSYLKTISETNGKISATTQSFDTAINANSTDNNVPTSKAVKTYVSQEINNLDVASVGSDGGYIKTISETNGKISAARQAFDISISSTSTNAPTSKAICAYLKSHEKTITLKDAAGNTLLSFVCYAPDATAYSPSLGTITLNTTTVI